LGSIYQRIADLERQHAPYVLCTVVKSQGSTPRGAGSKMLVLEDGSIIDTIGGGEMENRVIAEALLSLKDGNTRIVNYNFTDPKRGDPGVCGGQIEVYIEPNLPSPTLVVVGAGHVGRAVAHLGKWLGYRVVVSDDREEYSSPEAVPEAEQFHRGPLSELPDIVSMKPWTYVVLTTRGMNIDVEGLPRLLENPPGYIGVIGSRRRWAMARKQLIDKGVSEEQLKIIRSPIGLELNAETPEEIAVSILAEIIMLRRGGDGKFMQINADEATQELAQG
jgi:xanthine dehydrogenase accessory factor